MDDRRKEKGKEKEKEKEKKEKEETQAEFERLFGSRDVRAVLFNWGRKNGVKKTHIGADPGADQGSYASSKRRKLKRPRSESENEGSSFKTVISICSTSNTNSVIDSLIEKNKHVGEESDHESGTSSLPHVDTGEVHTDGRSGEQPEVVGTEMKIPKDKVDLVFGKGGGRITNMLASSDGTLEQTECAKQLVNEEVDTDGKSDEQPGVDTEVEAAKKASKKFQAISKVDHDGKPDGQAGVVNTEAGAANEEARREFQAINELDTDGRSGRQPEMKIPKDKVGTDGSSGRQPEVVHNELEIPKDKVDLVFDNGGETIKQMQAEGTFEQMESTKHLANESIISKLDTDGRSGRQLEMKIPKDKVGDEPDLLEKKLSLVNFSPGPSELNQDNTSTGDVGKGDGFSKYLLELDKAGIEVFEKLPDEVQCQLRESYGKVLAMKKFLIERNQKLLAQYLPPVEATQGDDLNSYLLEVYKAEVNRADINGFKELPDVVQALMKESHGQVQSFRNLMIKADRLTLARHLPPVALPAVVYHGDEEFIPLDD